MAINGIGGSAFNPYATNVHANVTANLNGVGAQRPIGGPERGTTTLQRPTTDAAATASPKSIAEAIKNDATSRAEQINSPKAPDGVDQELWSVLSKDERSFFVKAGAMGPLTYGRFASNQPTAAPMMRGGRLDIKA